MNGTCHPAASPSAVPSGAPSAVAAVSPATTVPIARARRWSGARRPATASAVAMYAPNAAPPIRRSAISTA